MRSCIVLGSARSGTSALSGTLQESGYVLGSRFDRATKSNPKGYFEDLATRQINNELLRPLATITNIESKQLFTRPLDPDWETWLAVRPEGHTFASPSVRLQDMQSVLTPKPFARKDPRFCLTLDAWRPVLGDAAFVCIFRHPMATARSILEHIDSVDSWRDVGLDLDGALKLWERSYRRVLTQHALSGDWLFLHFEQLLDLSALEPLGQHLEVHIKPDFIDPKLNRSDSKSGEAPSSAAYMYEELCDRARYQPLQRSLTAGRGPTVKPESSFYPPL